MARDREPFLSRWSRRKLDGQGTGEPAPPARADEATPPDLPPVDGLGFDSDYKGFLHPKVDEALRRQALKKLFGSAHFQQPCMLDDFNEDYTLLETLSSEVAQKLAHARRTLLGGEAEQATPEEAQAREGEAPMAPQEVAQAETPPPADADKDDGTPG